MRPVAIVFVRYVISKHQASDGKRNRFSLTVVIWCAGCHSNSIEVPPLHHLQHVFTACGDIPVYIVTVDGTGLVTMHEFCSVDQLDLLQPL